jgi:4-amino-4-deoxy-L-arabinose transferase-like glycosyltransferase
MNRNTSAIVRGALVLAATAGVLRLWALSWGLPLKYAHIDESVVVFYTLKGAAGTASGFFDYPGFFPHLFAAVLRGTCALGSLAGYPSFASRLAAYQDGDSAFFLLAGRGLNTVLGVLTVLLVFHVGRKREGLFVGGLAALLTATQPLHVLHCHYATTDVAAALLSLLALDRAMDWRETGRRRDGLWAGFLIGLGAATKYYPGLWGLFLLSRTRRRETVRFAGAALAGFVVGFPEALLDLPAFAARFGLLFSHVVSPSSSGTVFFLPSLKNLFVHSGGAAFLLALADGGTAFRRGGGHRRLLPLGWMAVTLFFGLWSAQSPHYILAAYPLVFLAAARAARDMGARFPRAPGILAAVLVLTTVIPAAQTLSRLAREDTRLAAKAWVRTHVPSGARILRFAHTPDFSRGDPWTITVDFTNRRLEPGSPEGTAGYDVVLYSRFDDQPPPAPLTDRYTLARKVAGPRPIFPHHPVVYIFTARRM